jgi:hypothetical protein
MDGYRHEVLGEQRVEERARATSASSNTEEASMTSRSDSQITGEAGQRRASKPVERGGWPALPISSWQDTRDTLHLWTQIVGKTKLALAPPLNHWWGVTLQVSASGLTTSLMPHGDAGLEVAFDFTEHALTLRTTTGAQRRMLLEARSVADFYREYRGHLASLGIDIPINVTPVEISEVVPFDQDTTHDSYDSAAAHDFWTSLCLRRAYSADSAASSTARRVPSTSSGARSTWRSRGSPDVRRRPIPAESRTVRIG